MTDVPPLPDGDDPYEILGAEPGDDLLALRRRYVALIRVHRPETSPAAFQRIREAWETVQAHFRYREVAAWEPPDETEEEGALPAASDPALERAAAAWREAADGRPEVALGALSETQGGPAAVGRAWAHRFLVRELARDPDAEETWHEALAAGAPVATWMRHLLDPPEQARLAGRLGRLPEQLRDQPDREAAQCLLRARVHDLLDQGACRQVAEELLEPEQVHQALGEYGIGWIATEAMAGIALEEPEAVAALREAYVPEATSALEELDVLAWDGAWAAPSYAAWAPFHVTKAMARFLRVAPVGDAWEVLERSRAFFDECMANPAAFLRRAEAMPNDLAHHYAARVAHVVESSGAPEGRRSSRVRLSSAMRGADERLRDAAGHRLWGFLCLVLSVIVLSLWSRIGAWTLLGLVAMAIVYFVGRVRLNRKLYSKRLRPALLRLVLEEGMNPQWMTDWIAKNGKKIDVLDEVVDQIADDGLLHAVYVTSRLGAVARHLEDA